MGHSWVRSWVIGCFLVGRFDAAFIWGMGASASDARVLAFGLFRRLHGEYRITEIYFSGEGSVAAKYYDVLIFLMTWVDLLRRQWTGSEERVRMCLSTNVPSSDGSCVTAR